MQMYRHLAVGIVSLVLASALGAQDKQSLTLASTTSLENSGLYRHILPALSKDTGIEVKVIPVGTGRALSIASRGDADLVIVHDEASELNFVAQGHGIERQTFMYNYYVLVGPKQDVAHIAKSQSVVMGLSEIARKRATFLSRGDQSGTHKKELLLWKVIGLTLSSKHSWYRESGSGMGATLNIANELGAYTIADTATWFSFRRRNHLRIIVADSSFLNFYSVILVNPQKHRHINYEQAKMFAEWLTRGRGIRLIDQFRFEGVKLFYPLAQNALPLD